MWSQYENGETVLINYSMIEQVILPHDSCDMTNSYGTSDLPILVFGKVLWRSPN